MSEIQGEQGSSPEPPPTRKEETARSDAATGSPTTETVSSSRNSDSDRADPEVQQVDERSSSGQAIHPEEVSDRETIRPDNEPLDLVDIAQRLAGESSTPEQVAQYQAALSFLDADGIQVVIDGDTMTARRGGSASESIANTAVSDRADLSAMARVRNLLGRMMQGPPATPGNPTPSRLPTNDELNADGGLTLPSNDEPGRNPEPDRTTVDSNSTGTEASLSDGRSDTETISPTEQRDRPPRARSVVALAALGSMLTAVISNEGPPSDTPFVKPGISQEGDTGTPTLAAVVEGTLDASALQNWAEHFEKDPEAQRVSAPEAATRIVDRVEKYTNGGYQIVSEEIQGHTSDEDDARDEDGERTSGLGERDARVDGLGSNEQDRLGAQRATVFGNLLHTTFDARNITHPKTTYLGPVEHILSPEQIAQVDTIADRVGVDRLSVIEGYNRDTLKFTPEAEAALFELLNENRRVDVAYTLVKPGEPPVDITYHPDVPLYAVIPVQNGPAYPQSHHFEDPDMLAPQHTVDVARSNKLPRVHNEGDRQRAVHGITRDKGGNRGKPTNTSFKGSRRGN